ncbi:MAG: MATE family efflux transporter [Clostridiales bacterium]|nr:MATE family efflux transporter [Clostridiales bacterium]
MADRVQQVKEETVVSSENQIIHGVIWKQLLLFFFPILLGTFFQQIYNTADTMIVGRFVGTKALAAVGSTGTFQNLIVGFFVGLSSGGTVIISQFFGGNDSENVGRAVHTAIALSLVGGAAIMLVGYVSAPAMLRLMNTPEDVLEPAVSYVRICFLGIIPVLIYNIGSGILRAIGDSRRPLYFLIISCLSNIVLDLLFVGVFRWGVNGAAFATIVAQGFSAFLILRLLSKSRESYRFRVKELRFDGSILKNIIRIGLPAGLQSILYSISNLIVQRSVNGFGTTTVASWTVFARVDSVYWMIIGAFGVAITTFVGQNFGAGKIDRVKKSVSVCLWITMGAAAALSVLLFFACTPIIRLFTADVDVQALSIWCMKHYCPFYCIFVVVEIYSGAMRGVGEALIPTLITAIGVGVLRILWVLVYLPLHYSLLTLLMTYPVTWLITASAFLFYYHKGHWLQRRIHAASINKAL